jgi:hypothetical protein
MQLEIIIQALRVRCPVFGNRVAGAAQFKMLQESAALAVPAAFVIPLDDAPQESIAINSVRQSMRDSFSVIVAVSNVADERGQTAAHDIDAMRAVLWAALLGWRPTLRYDGIAYEGGSVLAMDRARLWYQFEFGALMEIEPDDGFQKVELAGLGAFESMDIKIDVIDPIADPNLQYPGPDGRIEQHFLVPKSGSLSD